MWYLQFLNKPWRAYATGPDAFDCWGWVVFVLRERYGIVDVPRCLDVKTGDHSAYTQKAEDLQSNGVWQRVDKPVDGAVVLMGSRKLIRHIGIFESGSILHSYQGQGVCRQEEKKIKALIGFSRIEYWKHKDL